MLLRAKPDTIEKLIENYDKQVEDIKAGAMSMAWYMRGGMSYEDVLNLSLNERAQVNKLIENNLETTKKSQLPFF